MTTRNETKSSTYQQMKTSEMNQAESEAELLRKAVLPLNGHILGFVFGIIGALAIFVATNWLVLKGGETIGPHLVLLGQFFIGYSVTFIGSLIGAAYAFVFGYLGGFFIGWVYNAVVFLKTTQD